MSSFYWLDEPFERDRVPTAAALERATPLPVTSWEWAAAATDDIARPAAGLRDADPEAWRRKYVNEWVSPVVVPREAADLEAAAVAFTQEPLASGGPVSPAVDLTAAMRRCGLQLTPWQQRIAEAALADRGRLPQLTYPKQSGRRSISRVVAEALNGDPMPSSPSIVITLEPAVATFWDRLEQLAHELRIDPKGRRRRRVKVEQRRIRQAMRHIDRRAARRQRRAASRAARGGAR